MAAMDGEANLGYVFHAFQAGASLGYAAVDLFLVAAGLDDGFATAQLILPIWESDDSASRVTLTEQWSGAGELHVAPGIVTIRSYGGGEQSAYCFGGALTCVRSQPGRLHCKLTSPAPILNLGEEGMDWAENVVLRVVDGIESELAAARADGHLHSAVAFNARLAHTDPRLLYAVGLVKAQHSFAMLPDILRTENYWVEHNTLTHALHEAQDSGWWPSEATLSAVLGQA
jgi:hypothetical protein